MGGREDGRGEWEGGGRGEGEGEGEGEVGSVVQKRESPYFRSLEVGISASVTAQN